jgi:porin
LQRLFLDSVMQNGLVLTLLLPSVVLAAGPQTPDRPGRPTPEQAGTSGQQVATTQPYQSTSAVAGETGSDADLLRETAKDLNEKPPESRPDQEILNWFGLRPKLESEGITFQGTDTADYSKNFRGGIDTSGDAFRNLLDMRFNVDTRALFGMYGGTFSIDFQNQNGQNGSDKLTGDVQGFDNADADGRTQIAELWYQQLLFEDKLRIKVGKVDANSEFAFPEYGAGFLNSSFGHSPTLFPMPTYPDPSTSVNVFVYPTRWLYAGVGVYDGSGAAGVNTGSYGPHHLFDGTGDYFTIGEAGVRWVLEENTKPGRFAVGEWYAGGDFDRFEGGTDSGANGFYAMLEQTLWHKNFYDKTGEQGVAGFLQYGHADAEVSDVVDYAGAGLTWTGPMELRKDDTVGVGLAYAHLSNEPGAGFDKDYELSVETYYGFQVTPYLLVKPDLQYIFNPGGSDQGDALVATLRVSFAF